MSSRKPHDRGREIAQTLGIVVGKIGASRAVPATKSYGPLWVQRGTFPRASGNDKDAGRFQPFGLGGEKVSFGLFALFFAHPLTHLQHADRDLLKRSSVEIVFHWKTTHKTSRGGKMRHQQKTVAKRDWDGEFGNYDEWAKLGPQPPYRSAIFLDAQGRRCVTQHDFVRARDDRGFPVTYRWESEPRKRR
jgi:hypothetical protein